MIKTTLGVSGMSCGMCEAHVNDAVRNAFKIKKVSSSRARGETVILSEAPLDKDALCGALGAAGYGVTGVKEEAYRKTPLLKRVLSKKP